MKRLCLSLRFSSAGKTEKNHEISPVRVFGVPAEIRAGYVPSSVSFGSTCWT